MEMLALAIYTFIWSWFLLSWIHHNLFYFLYWNKAFWPKEDVLSSKDVYKPNVSISPGVWGEVLQPFTENQTISLFFLLKSSRTTLGWWWIWTMLAAKYLDLILSQMEQTTLQIHGNYFQLHFGRDASYMYSVNTLGHCCKIAYRGSHSLLLEAPPMAYSKSGSLLYVKENHRGGGPKRTISSWRHPTITPLLPHPWNTTTMAPKSAKVSSSLL